MIGRRAPGSPAAAPALRVAAWSMLTVLLGTGMSLTWQLARIHRYDTARAEAVATARGTVIEDHVDGRDAVRVRWRDLAGDVHEDRFAVVHPSRYRTGAPFEVRYDPGEPSPRAFPADERELTTRGDAEGWAVLAGLVAAGSGLAWLTRGVRARVAGERRAGAARDAGAAARPMSADPLAGLASMPLGPYGVGPALGWQSWLRLRDAHAPEAGVWLQRVMWHPVLDTLDPGTAVTVTGRLGGKRRGRRPLAVVVQAPPGAGAGTSGVAVRLVPVGRPRRDAPASVLLLPRKDARTHLRPHAWVSAGGDVPPRRLRSLLRLVAAAVAGAVLPLWWLAGAAELPSLLGLVAASAGLTWGMCAEEP